MSSMLAQIKNWKIAALSLLVTLSLISCATKEPQRLVSDPDERPESVLPWNKQEKWEVAPQLQGMRGPQE